MVSEIKEAAKDPAIQVGDEIIYFFLSQFPCDRMLSYVKSPESGSEKNSIKC